MYHPTTIVVREEVEEEEEEENVITCSPYCKTTCRKLIYII